MSAPSPLPHQPTADPLLVACLCAQWCRTCDAYRDTLLAARQTLQLHADIAARFLWVDIEDESELVGDLDIEDFPTLLLARGDAILFFGPILPHAQTIDRLLRGAVAGELPPLSSDTLVPDVRVLPARLRAHAAL